MLHNLKFYIKHFNLFWKIRLHNLKSYIKRFNLFWKSIRIPK